MSEEDQPKKKRTPRKPKRNWPRLAEVQAAGLYSKLDMPTWEVVKQKENLDGSWTLRVKAGEPYTVTPERGQP